MDEIENLVNNIKELSDNYVVENSKAQKIITVGWTEEGKKYKDAKLDDFYRELEANIKSLLNKYPEIKENDDLYNIRGDRMSDISELFEANTDVLDEYTIKTSNYYDGILKIYIPENSELYNMLKTD